MSSTNRKTFDIEIRDLSEEHVAEVARLHALCFPGKIETLLGEECIAETLHRRFLGPERDSFCRIAVDRSTGRLAAYLYHTPWRKKGDWAHMFVHPGVMRTHLFRKGWFSPRIWAFTVQRMWYSLFAQSRNEGDLQEPPPNAEVAKMLAIAPDFRGGNVGVDMMLDGEAQARQRGARRVCGLIERNNIKAEKLYASIGWVRTSPDRNDFAVFAMHHDL